MDGAHIYRKVLRLCHKSKRFCQNLNLFPSVPPSTDEHELKDQRISTRLYILLLIILLTILLLYTSLSNVTQTLKVEKPTLEEYSRLYSTYSQTLTCPCTHISINYGDILHIEYTLHQVCSSDFITDTWISRNDVINFNFHINIDTRIGMSYALAALQAFCELIESTIYNGLIQFNSTQYITSSVVSLETFQSQTQSIFDQFRSSTTNTFLLSLNMTRKITQGNAFLSGQLTNYNLRIKQDFTVKSTSMEYSGCNCRLAGTCIKQLSIHSSSDKQTLFDVPGFYTGCYAVESLLQSNLQCFYEQTCIDQLQTYMSVAALINTTALDSSFPSEYSPDTSIENLLKKLMIEQWNATRSYHRYYKECQPVECTYTIETRASIVYIITTLFGIVGGLITVLRCTVPRVVKVVRKKKDRSSQSNFAVVLCTFIRHLYPRVKNSCATLNVFPSVPPSTDEHELKNQRISTRLFLLLLIILLTILVLYTSLINVTQTINIKKPTVEEYLHLYSTYSQALTCPCEHVSVNYGKFLRIEYTLHQVCSSVFIGDQWISDLAVSSGDTLVDENFLWTGPNMFQSLRAFCELIQGSIINNLIEFNSSQYISASVAPFELFQAQAHSSVAQFRSSTTNNFLFSLNIMRNTTYKNGLLSGLLTDVWLLAPDHDEVKVGPAHYSDCNCAVSNNCIKQAVVWSNLANEGDFAIPGFYIGCYVIEALLQSNLQCFHDQNCLNRLLTYLPSSATTNTNALNSSVPSQYDPSTTIETLLNSLMLEQWNSTPFYNRYYNECQPIQCSYTISSRNSIIYIITALVGIFGGLITVLRCAVPPVVKFIRKKKERTQEVNVMKKAERIRMLWQKLKDFWLNLNLFSSSPPSTDPVKLGTQRIFTKLFILFLILASAILLLYTALENIQMTVNENRPTRQQYLQLHSTYTQSLTCPCKHISISYGKFIHIQHALHQVCSSFYMNDSWSYHISTLQKNHQTLYVSGDFRMTGPLQFQALRAFCQLIESTITDSLVRFNSRQYVSASVVPFELFQSQTQSFIDQFEYSTNNSFLLSLNMTRKMIQGNALIGGGQTNYKVNQYFDINEPSGPDYDPKYIRITSRSYNCRCAKSMTCIDNSSLFTGTDNRRDFNVTNFYVGCYTIESLFQSNLRCFYDQDCLDQLQYYLESSVIMDIPPLNSSSLSRYYPNTTIENLLNNLMIEQWNSTRFHDRYYNECQPIQCSYRIPTRNNLVYIITTLFGIIGGWTKISKIVIPILINTIVYCIRKWKNRVHPQISNDQT